jgi:hypothetical protein
MTIKQKVENRIETYELYVSGWNSRQKGYKVESNEYNRIGSKIVKCNLVIRILKSLLEEN